jgi:hypothetical protein
VAGTLIETYDSRTFEQSRNRKSATWKLKAFNCSDVGPVDASMEAYNLAAAYLPDSYAGMQLESISTPQAFGSGSFYIEGRYSSVAPEAASGTPGDPVTDLPEAQQPAEGSDSNAVLPGGFSFQIGTRPVRSNKSLETLDKVENAILLPNGPRDFKGAVGVGRDGQVSGYEDEEPTGSFSMEFTMTNVTVGLLKLWQDTVGLANATSWGIWKKRALVFAGVEGTIQTGTFSQSIRAHFRNCPAVAAHSAGGITVPDHSGTDIEWAFYDVDPDGNLVPFQVNIERVKGEFEFRKFGFGDGVGGTAVGV